MNIEDINPKSLFTDVEVAKRHIMTTNLSDMAKLKYVFDLSKKDLKKRDPQLYYAILAILHSAKCMKCAGMLTAPSDYFGTPSKSKEDKYEHQNP